MSTSLKHHFLIARLRIFNPSTIVREGIHELIIAREIQKIVSPGVYLLLVFLLTTGVRQNHPPLYRQCSKDVNP